MCFFRKKKKKEETRVSHEDYDFKRLRRDVETEFTAQGALTTGGYGYAKGIEARHADEEELLKMAKELGLRLDKYRK